MNPPPNEERISAYLDGELSPDERAEVEKSLAENPELRQLCDELRAVRASMQALPRHALPHDLAPLVVRQAERCVLAGPTPTAEPVRQIASWWLRGAGWRRLAWPAAIAATALLMVLLDRQRNTHERPVAQTAPHAESYIGAAPAAPTQQAAAQDDRPQAGRGLREEPGEERLSYQNEPATPGAANPATDREPDAAAKAQSSPAEAPRARMFQNAAAAPAPSGAAHRAMLREAPAGTAEDAATNIARDGAQTTFVCDVSAEFVRTKAFEKLLDENKIAWQFEPTPSPPADRGAAPNADENERLAMAEGQRIYVVKIGSEQRDQVVSQLRATADDFKIAPEKPAKAKAGSDAKMPQVVRFVLRWSAAPPASKPKP